MSLFLCVMVEQREAAVNLTNAQTRQWSALKWANMSILSVSTAALLWGSELHQLVQQRLFSSRWSSCQLLRQFLWLQLSRSEEPNPGGSQSPQTGRRRQAATQNAQWMKAGRDEWMNELPACRVAMNWWRRPSKATWESSPAWPLASPSLRYSRRILCMLSHVLMF